MLVRYVVDMLVGGRVDWRWGQCGLEVLNCMEVEVGNAMTTLLKLKKFLSRKTVGEKAEWTKIGDHMGYNGEDDHFPFFLLY